MSSSRRDGRNACGFGGWISAWLPVLVGICLIATESTTYLGADHTTGPLRLVFQALFGQITDASWENIHYFIRKSGHFVGYGLLGLLWLRAWRMTLPRLRFLSCAGLALLSTGLVACCDEWHQSFLPNRGASPVDVLLDCCGAAAFLLAAHCIVRVIQPSRLEDAA